MSSAIRQVFGASGPSPGWGIPGLVLLGAIASEAATLRIEAAGPEVMVLSLGADESSYFLVEQSWDLGRFTPFTMVLGDAPHVWNIFPDADSPARFFRSSTLSAFASSDSDGDGIDDVYEIRHPVLNPLASHDALLDPDNNGQTYLEEYRSTYNLGSGRREAISDEVSVFSTRPFTGPSVEAISDEVSEKKMIPPP